MSSLSRLPSEIEAQMIGDLSPREQTSFARASQRSRRLVTEVWNRRYEERAAAARRLEAYGVPYNGVQGAAQRKRMAEVLVNEAACSALNPGAKRLRGADPDTVENGALVLDQAELIGAIALFVRTTDFDMFPRAMSLSLMRPCGENLRELTEWLQENKPPISSLDIRAFRKEELGAILEPKGVLSDERILERLPDVFAHFPSLEKLDASMNYLTSLPPSLGRCALQELNLRKNCLRRVPEVIGRMGTLKKLDLSEQLRGLSFECDALWNANELRELNLADNQFRTLPEEVGRLQKLEKLSLAGNRLIHLPQSLLDLPHLEELDLRGTNLPLGGIERFVLRGKERGRLFTVLVDGTKEPLEGLVYTQRERGFSLEATLPQLARVDSQAPTQPLE